MSYIQPSPCCMIAFQPKDSLQPQSIGPAFLIGNMPHCLKTKAQRLSRTMKKSAGSYRGLAQAFLVLKQPSRGLPHFLIAACRAFKSLRPAQVNKIVKARLLCRKAIPKFGKIWGEIVHMTTHYMLWFQEPSA